MVASGSNDDNILFVSGCVVCLLSKGVFPTVRHIQKSIFVLVFGINAAHGSAVKGKCNEDSKWREVCINKVNKTVEATKKNTKSCFFVERLHKL